MNEGKLYAQAIGDGGSSLRASRIGTHNHGVLKLGNVLLYIPLQQGPTVQIVHRYVEESLVLGIMEIQRHYAAEDISSKLFDEHQSQGSPPEGLRRQSSKKLGEQSAIKSETYWSAPAQVTKSATRVPACATHRLYPGWAWNDVIKDEVFS